MPKIATVKFFNDEKGFLALLCKMTVPRLVLAQQRDRKG